ncbi:MAG TPA: 16S rRNA (cytosine(1402)-N(4))-methyltransferase RsmH, partial [Acidobacteriota bacterium]|nr:16S rRNA (cytosine(1402)-N(4))-methyltransferase RsmH [Acidobacteriota bacterium]
MDRVTRAVRRATVRLPHEPVLRDEALDLWVTPWARRVVDGTVGRAGHSLSLLGARDDVRLLAIDRDVEAVEFVSRRFVGFGSRVQVIHGSYADLAAHLAETHAEAVDGILLDLGVSSPQLDDPERGFSHRAEGPLDLRFDPSQGIPASEWLATVELAELQRVLREYGEEPRSGAAARALLAARDRGPIATTAQLREAVSGRCGRPGEPPAKSFSRVFQALRIVVNDELAELDRFLARLPDCLAERGRVVILSYHSLEDRRVKAAFREAARTNRMSGLTARIASSIRSAPRPVT